MKTTVKYMLFWILWYSQIARISRLLSRGSVVLSYHRLCSEPNLCNQTSAPSLIVTRSNFDKQLRYIQQKYNLSSLQGVVENPKKRTLSVTFDDAYSETIDILNNSKYSSIPIAIFVPTNFVVNKISFWWDNLWTAFLAGSYKGKVLLGGNEVVLDLSQNKLAQYEDIANQIRLMPYDKQEGEVNSILQKIGGNQSLPLVASLQKLIKFAARDNITIGNHTSSHLNVAKSSKVESISNFKKADSIISTKLGVQSKFFAFPFGDKYSISGVLDSEMKKMGYLGAVTLVPGEFNHGNNPFRIPRINVLDEPMFVFKTKLTPVYWWILKAL